MTKLSLRSRSSFRHLNKYTRQRTTANGHLTFLGGRLSGDNSSLRQSKHHHRLVTGAAPASSPTSASAGGNHGDILFTVLALIRHRCCGDGVVERGGPQLFAGPRIECAKTTVSGGADEDQSSRGRDRSTAACRAYVFLTLRHVVVDAERNLPGDVAGV